MKIGIEEMPQKIKDILYTAKGLAASNWRYKKVIPLYERYYRKYRFDMNQKYRMGLIYDHRAMQIGVHKKKIFDFYLKKAERLYREILKEDPSYFHALYGIGRLHSIRGDYKKAITVQTEAYKIMLRRPRSERGALAIGYLYEMLGDSKNAEKWYLREYRDTPRSDFGTALNLFQFYKKNKKIKKALRYGLLTEKLMKIEYKKKIYKGMKMNSSEFVVGIKRDLKEIKKGIR
jgi:tetratricopeptide (TPR) repeat protein